MQNLVLSPISTDTLIEMIAARTAEIISQKHEPQPEAKELLTIPETAELLSVNKSTIWRYTRSGKLIQYGISGRTYYKRSEVLEAVKSLK